MKPRTHRVLILISSLAAAALACQFLTGNGAAPSATDQPAAAPQNPASTEGMPEFITDADELADLYNNDKVQFLDTMTNEPLEDTSYTPHVEHYTVSMTPDTVVDMGPGWCSRTESIRTDNKGHWSGSVTVNGQEISGSELRSDEWKTSDGKFCFVQYAVARDWPVGVHKVRVSFTFDAPINDGWDDYAAGEYMTEYTVTVTAGAARPTPTAATGAAPAPTPAAAAPADNCVTWDAVTTSMKGDEICIRGLITKFDRSPQFGTRYSFSDKRNTFFLLSIKYEVIDPNTGKTIAPGTCVEVTGKVDVQGDAPYMNLDPMLEDDSGDHGTFQFYKDKAACE